MDKLLILNDDLIKEELSNDQDFEKYNALIPFKDKNLLSPIYITKSLLYSLERADKCLSLLP